MPDDLRPRLEARAKANGRSSNAEIVAILTAAIDAQSHLASVPAEDLLKEVVARLGASLQLVVSKDAADVAGIKGAPKPTAKRHV